MIPEIEINFVTGTTSTRAIAAFTGCHRKRTRQFTPGRVSRWLAAALVIVAVLGGCTVGADYKGRDVVVPVDWRNASEQRESIANLRWWQLFEDPTLQELIGAALVANRDLRLAAARVLEARAQLGIVRALASSHN